jgi:multimeric flavodoxin WrbA
MTDMLYIGETTCRPSNGLSDCKTVQTITLDENWEKGEEDEEKLEENNMMWNENMKKGKGNRKKEEKRRIRRRRVR